MASGVPDVEVDLLLATQLGGDAAPGHRVGLADRIGVLNDLEGLQNLLDRLHTGVGTARFPLLPIVLVDVAELALHLAAEVLTDPKDREIEEIAPFDAGRDVGDGLAAGKSGPVVRGHRGEFHATHLRPFQDQDQPPVRRAGDAVGRRRVQPDRNDGAAEIPGSAGEADLFGRMQVLLLLHLGNGHQVEGEDEIRLGFVPGRDGQGIPGESDSRAQEVLLEDHLAGQVLILFGQRFDQVQARVHELLI